MTLELVDLKYVLSATDDMQGKFGAFWVSLRSSVLRCSPGFVVLVCVVAQDGLLCQRPHPRSTNIWNGKLVAAQVRP